jgi:aerobic carbon-monoxide dehydrogenase medium subunit
MYTSEFEYHRPATVAEAIKILGKNKDAKIIAGGHSLLPAMKLRVAEPAALVDIGRIKGLSGIKAGKSGTKIGAMTTHAAIVHSEDIAKYCNILHDAASVIGDVQVRNRGTIGGSLAHADPGADYPTVMLALDAEMTAQGKSSRTIPAAKFFKDLFTTALKRDEILTSVSIRAMGKGEGGAYVKHRHPASGYAVVGVAALVTVKLGLITAASIAIGGASGMHVRAPAAEKSLIGKAPTDETFAAAGALAAQAITMPMSDTYASADYRTHLASVLTKRALMAARGRAV